jgi:hypothetical protein
LYYTEKQKKSIEELFINDFKNLDYEF